MIFCFLRFSLEAPWRGTVCCIGSGSALSDLGSNCLLRPICPAGLHCAAGSASDCRSSGRKFESQLGYITFMEVDYGIISMVILPLLLSQKGQLSVTCKSLCTSTG